MESLEVFSQEEEVIVKCVNLEILNVKDGRDILIVRLLLNKLLESIHVELLPYPEHLFFDHFPLFNVVNHESGNLTFHCLIHFVIHLFVAKIKRYLGNKIAN
jgi:hypothetical protein